MLANKRRPINGILIPLALVFGAVNSRALANPITTNYSVSGSVTSYPSDSETWVGFVSSTANNGGILPSAWSEGPVLLGSFAQSMPDTNEPGYNSYNIPFMNVPFTITIAPTQLIPPNLPASQTTVTGPTANGAVIHGVINGLITSTGQSNLVATFQSVTPNNMTAYFNGASLSPTLNYQVDPSLSNPFPISQLVLPQSLDLTLNGQTQIYATVVPEPSSFLVFAIGLVARVRAANNKRPGARGA
jgi:hypothetical protein